LKPGDWVKQEKIDIPDEEKLRSTIFLTDGGVYDNLGLEHIWQRYTTVLASDAGAPFVTVQGSPGLRINQLQLSIRAIDIITEQARSLRKRWLITNFNEKKMGGTYWGISTHIRDYKLVENDCLPPLIDDSEETRSLSLIRTRLNRFKVEEQERLINWGYALTDAAMRRHVPQSGTTPGTLPFP
jgi:NTE family protein